MPPCRIGIEAACSAVTASQSRAPICSANAVTAHCHCTYKHIHTHIHMYINEFQFHQSHSVSQHWRNIFIINGYNRQCELGHTSRAAISTSTYMRDAHTLLHFELMQLNVAIDRSGVCYVCDVYACIAVSPHINNKSKRIIIKTHTQCRMVLPSRQTECNECAESCRLRHREETKKGQEPWPASFRLSCCCLFKLFLFIYHQIEIWTRTNATTTHTRFATNTMQINRHTQ